MAVFSNVALLLASFLAACIPCITEEVGFSSGLASVVDRVSSRPHTDPEWDYTDGPNGPAHWGELSIQWKRCNSGSHQAPVDVEAEAIHPDGTLDVPAKIFYKPAPAFIYGDGKILEVQWAAGIYNCHDFDYVLEKLVFHSPSEHTYYGERFPLEIQFYHSHPKEGVAINSLVFREGQSNEWLQQFIPSLPTTEKLGQTISIGLVNSAGVEGGDLDWTRYFRYLGSLTTPPCTERPSVVWSLLKEPLTASKQQIQKIQESLLNKPNARPLQSLGTRHVFYPRGVDGSKI